MRRLLIIILVLLAAAVVLPIIGDAVFGWGPDESVLPPEGRAVDIGEGRTLNVYEVGSGKPIILVHGWASCANDWAELPQRLAALDHRVIYYDRAGYGYSTRLPASYGRYSHSSNARDLIALMNALELPKASLVGWSFGGAVVQRVALDVPQRVDRLTLLSSVGPGSDEGEPLGLVDRILTSPLAAPILSWVSMVPPLSYKMTHDSLSQAFSDPRSIPTGWTIYTEAMLGLPGTFKTIAGESSSPRSELPIGQIQTPTLVIHGSEDRLTPYPVGEALDAALPNSALESVVGGSHMLPVTHPDQLAARIHELVGTEYVEGGLPGSEP
jgi:pimeloyl-ACP methyl ester carboxylesterase